MSRKRYAERQIACERWPKLWNTLGYFGQDYRIMFGSVEGAIERIISDYPTQYRRDVLHEWREANAEVAWKEGFKRYLNDAFPVDIHFDDDAAARLLWNRLYDRLIESVRRDTAP